MVSQNDSKMSKLLAKKNFICLLWFLDVIALSLLVQTDCCLHTQQGMKKCYQHSCNQFEDKNKGMHFVFVDTLLAAITATSLLGSNATSIVHLNLGAQPTSFFADSLSGWRMTDSGQTISGFCRDVWLDLRVQGILKYFLSGLNRTCFMLSADRGCLLQQLIAQEGLD